MPPRVERKLMAILAADVAGYSKLMGADKEGTFARLKAHRRLRQDVCAHVFAPNHHRRHWTQFTAGSAPRGCRGDPRRREASLIEGGWL